MCSHNEQKNQLDSPAYRELRLMSEVYETPESNQRQMSLKLGIALGLTNVLLKSLIQKGFVRVSNASWKRRLYNLTPEGLVHKLQLTTGYVSRVLDHYQNVRQTLRQQMEDLNVNEESRIAVCGANEFAELVYLGLKELGIGEIAFYSTGKSVGERFLGVPVDDITAINSDFYDKVVIADLYDSKALNQLLLDLNVPEQKIVIFFTQEHVINGRPES